MVGTIVNITWRESPKLGLEFEEDLNESIPWLITRMAMKSKQKHEQRKGNMNEHDALETV
jgi:hypothetical protein